VLDISIIDNSGSVEEYVSLTADAHWDLLSLAEKGQLNLWMRMRDYFEDADYDPSEVKSLRAEVRVLKSKCHDSDLAQPLAQIEALLGSAIERGFGVSAISD
jgi:hypothetical protein